MVSPKTNVDIEANILQKVRLLIIDEVHLLNEDRGAVIEAIVARTLRQVDSTRHPSLCRLLIAQGGVQPVRDTYCGSECHTAQLR